jgi:Ca2+-binding EF-hand superfamily protein
MDKDRNGVITRAEWRGSTRSFEVHDWNRDGVLSGDEVRAGGRRADAPKADRDLESPDAEYTFDDWTARGFTGLDHNKDNRISRDEWHFDREGFRRADHNADGTISRAEFLNEDEQQDDDRDDRFGDLDGNRDGRISREEWHGGAGRFQTLDANRDGFLSRTEMVGSEPPVDLFTSVDVNRDGSIGRDEWHWSRGSFDTRDANRDGRLTKAEFAGEAAQSTRSPGYRAGYDRGVTEGRAAGREDRVRNQGWDLEGQRELETADSGYQPSVGSRADYQAGYRDGFRRAYREGWDQK